MVCFTQLLPLVKARQLLARIPSLSGGLGDAFLPFFLTQRGGPSAPPPPQGELNQGLMKMPHKNLHLFLPPGWGVIPNSRRGLLVRFDCLRVRSPPYQDGGGISVVFFLHAQSVPRPSCPLVLLGACNAAPPPAPPPTTKPGLGRLRPLDEALPHRGSGAGHCWGRRAQGRGHSEVFTPISPRRLCDPTPLPWKKSLPVPCLATPYIEHVFDPQKRICSEGDEQNPTGNITRRDTRKNVECHGQATPCLHHPPGD